MQSFVQLPRLLPVFPLENAIVLPGSRLPLNIFEPRYLNMVEDALKTDHLIGMIQPSDNSRIPRLYQVGCAGRITRFEETQDGRIEIILSGLCRFRIQEEISCLRGYRMVKPEWKEFAQDFEESEPVAEDDIQHMLSVLKSFMKCNGMDADWNLLERMSASELASTMISILPLRSSDRQMLVEVESLEDRIHAFTAILNDCLDDRHNQH